LRLCAVAEALAQALRETELNISRKGRKGFREAREKAISTINIPMCFAVSTGSIFNSNSHRGSKALSFT
jgi:hypothetical protein